MSSEIQQFDSALLQQEIEQSFISIRDAFAAAADTGNPAFRKLNEEFTAATKDAAINPNVELARTVFQFMKNPNRIEALMDNPTADPESLGIGFKLTLSIGEPLQAMSNAAKHLLLTSKL